ncbi:LytR family transcriptional regulator [Paenibacillus ginsengarvi]|uniref:LytR family transcriptional regulator n=2 Tax=Paenibacillus ginsengarvi TaxID=400777 RepID=A0A3B0AQ61_9BACL|nr:LytR family transcriptional regulator [Paenibacillus ginsengarvi]
MKRIYTYLICGAVAVLLLAGFELYSSLAPERHFRSDQLPVLASPSTSLTASAEPTAAIAETAVAQAPLTAPDPAPATVKAEPPNAKASEPASGFNALILGIDGENGGGRSDVIIVVHVDPDKKSVALVSVPRDTRVSLPGIGMTKLNHAYFLGELQGRKKGVQASVEAVSSLFRIPVHYYVKTDFLGFSKMIDAIGGVDIELPQDMLLSGSETVLRQGVRHLDGNTALEFVRERYSLAGGDFDRQADQAALLKAVAAKMLTGEQLPRLPRLIKQAKEEFVETNMSVSDIASLTLLFKDKSELGIRHVTLPGKALTEDDPLLGSKLWYWSVDAGEVEAVARDYLR